MDAHFTEERELLRRSARELLARECPTSLVRAQLRNPRGAVRSLWDRLIESGRMGLGFGEDAGGADLSVVAARASAGEEGVDLFALDARTPGVATPPFALIDGTRNSATRLFGNGGRNREIVARALVDG